MYFDSGAVRNVYDASGETRRDVHNIDIEIIYTIYVPVDLLMIYCRYLITSIQMICGKRLEQDDQSPLDVYLPYENEIWITILVHTQFIGTYLHIHFLCY